MSTFVDSTVEQLLALQVRLYGCRARLTEATDDEALHDLRVTLRRMRSLLRPLRGLPTVDSLEQAAAALGRLTGPLRDREVLQAQLRQLGANAQADAMARELAPRRAEVALARELEDLLVLLDAWPQRWRQAAANAELDHLQRRIQRRLQRQQQRLALALRDPAHDRHRLRLLIKRVRYAAEAYPRESGLSRRARVHLKHAQGALGDWHDNLQWLALAETEPALAPYRTAWQAAMQAAEQQADDSLLVLRADFAQVD
ncbi:CHAD domain-containing protein [Pseudomonas sp. NCHU5208]|uniref:CHAD domain-containing protein n=1 Tax=unclassified Pseudomonas TaxID=196821 RepID=UPI003F98AA8B